MFPRNDEQTDGIFVINGQVFSVNDIITVMRRQGIRIRFEKDGLNIDGEYISSITNLDGNKCPLARNCDKRIALVEFLKLQKNSIKGDSSIARSIDQPHFTTQEYQQRKNNYRREESCKQSDPFSRDYIQPNNHDLFDGNVSESLELFDNSHEEEIRGLFDEPEFNINNGENYFENSFFNQNDHSESVDHQKNSFGTQRMQIETRELNQLYCEKCGFDLDKNWNSCPKCGFRVNIQGNNRSESEYFY